MVENYFAIHIINVLALVFLCCLIRDNKILDIKRKGPFYLAIATAVIVILSEAGTIIAADSYADLRFLNILCNLIGFALTPVIPIFLLAIFDIKIFGKKKALMLPSIVNFLVTALSPWLGLVFYIDAGNHYARGSSFFIFVLTYIINIIILLIGTVATAEKHHYSIRVKIGALSLFVFVGTSIQIIIPSIYSTWHSVTLSLLLYYLLLSEFDASFDALTGLHNRAAYDEIANKLNGRKPYSVIVMDINEFKEINDKYGHDYGDDVLETIAAVIRKAFDKRCTWYRIGGDEFCIINSETAPAKIELQLKNMTDRLEEERLKDGRLPTVAYGYSICKGFEPDCFQRLLREADTQMYHFKKIQKDRQGAELQRSL